MNNKEKEKRTLNMAKDKNTSSFLPHGAINTMDIGTLLSKLNTNDPTPKSQDEINALAMGMPEISSDIDSKLKNIEYMLEMFPDLELAVDIMVSSILSPNDMSAINPMYEIDDVLIPIEVSNLIVNKITMYLNNEFKLPNKLPRIIKESKYTKGAYITLVLPESKITETMTENEITLECAVPSVTSNLIALENGLKLSDEVSLDMSDDLLLDITSDFNVLNLADATNKMNEFSLESGVFNGTITGSENKFLERLFTVNKGEDVAVITVNDHDSGEVDGTPMIKNLPVQSCIPVFRPSSPDEHLGYFVLLDESGSPVIGTAETDAKKVDTSNDVNSTVVSSTTGTNKTDEILNKASEALSGMTSGSKANPSNPELYAALLDQSIRQKMANGIVGKNVTIELDDVNDVYNIMFQRFLAGHKTTMLFLPKSYISYIAFDHRANGTGKSLLEKLTPLGSLTAMLLLASVNAGVRNSIPLTNVTATIPEAVVEKEKEMARVISGVLKTNQMNLPTGVNGIGDLTKWIHRAGISVKFEGPGIPDFTIDKNQTNQNVQGVDDEIIERFTKKLITAIGPNPEMIDSANGADFAATIIANNKLLSKRVSNIQDEGTPQLGKLASLLISHNGVIKKEIMKILESNSTAILKKVKNSTDSKIKIKNEAQVLEWLFNWICKNITVTLPKPETYETNNLKEAFAAYKDEVEESMDVVFSSDILPSEILGDLADKIDEIKEVAKGIIYRKWMLKNQYLDEVSSLITLNRDGEPEFDILNEHTNMAEALYKTIVPFLKKNKKFSDKINDKLDKIENGEDEEEVPVTDEAGDDNTNDENTDTSDTGDGFGDDSGLDDTTGDMGDGDTPEDIPEEPVEEPVEDLGGDDDTLDDEPVVE